MARRNGGDDAYRESDDDDDDDEEMLSDDADVYQGAQAAGAGGRAARAANRRKKANGSAPAAKANGDAAVRQTAQVAAKMRKAGASGAAKEKGYAWEATYKRSWDAVREDEGGSLAGAVRGLLEANKRRRTLHDAAPVQRGIIRHVVLILDLSESMLEKDLRPSRLSLMLQYAREFVAEYFDQNPIGQLSILATRDGIAERVTSMGGNTAEHIEALQSSRKLQPKGEPSLQNALEMAKSNLAHLPTANSREVLVIFGSLTTCDPGNIHDTVAALAREHVRVSMICLAAEVKVCKEICKKTQGKFGVCIDEGHFRELLFMHINPPEILEAQAKQQPRSRDAGEHDDDDDLFDEGVDLMQMGFPTRLPTNNAPTMCACHNRLKSGGFVCPRCMVKLCDVPTDCPVCGLTVVMSTHLARSYHHLFPIANFKAVHWQALALRMQPSSSQPAVSTTCLGCAVTFEKLPKEYAKRLQQGADDEGQAAEESEQLNANVASSGRYECPKCANHFCLECDSFIHESLHQCPGCR